MSKAAHLQKGEDAETASCIFLRQQGLKLVCRNYRCRYGEIDLVMQDGDTLVFTEVRFRTDRGYGDGLDSITPAKQHRLRRAAEHYLQHEGCCNARFDVVSVSKKNQTRHKSITRSVQDFIQGFQGDELFDFDWVRDAF